MIKKYRKKPVVIEAIQYTKDNYWEIADFVGNTFLSLPDNEGNICIGTLEGTHIARLGDYIIKGIKREFYSCKPDIFELTYEEV